MRLSFSLRLVVQVYTTATWALADHYDKSGAYGVATGTTEDKVSLYEFTGQGSWTVGKHYELRLEVRADMSNKDEFVKGTTDRKNQVTGLLAALAYY